MKIQMPSCHISRLGIDIGIYGESQRESRRRQQHNPSSYLTRQHPFATTYVSVCFLSYNQEALLDLLDIYLLDMASNPSVSTSTISPAEAVLSQVFHPFKLFPPEIRHMVWLQASLEPRVIELGFYYDTKVKNHKVVRNTSKTVVPALLHACSESREIGLSHYEAFIPTGVWTGTYISWAQDYMYLDCSQRQYTDFDEYQQRLKQSSPFQKAILPQKCRRLLLGKRLHPHRNDLFALFDSLEEVAVLHRPYLWYGYHRGENEITGIIGANITLVEVDYTEIKSEVVEEHDWSYHCLWSHVDLHRKKWKKVSLVKAQRNSHSPLSKEGKAIRRERERQEKLDLMAPVKPIKTVFKNWKVQDLKFEANDRGLSNKGTKSDLVTRLQEDEQVLFYQAFQEYKDTLDQYRKAKESKSAIPTQV